MLMNLHKTVWTEALTMPDFATEGTKNQASLEKLVSLAEGYEKRVREEGELTKDQLRTRYVGKVDPKKHIEQVGQDLIEDNIVAVSRQMIDKEASVPSHYEGGGKGAGGVSVENAMSILNKRQANGGGGHSHGKMEVDGDAEEDL